MIECDKCHCFHQETDAHHIADESDEEIILENNQLYKYLKEQCKTNLLQKPPDSYIKEETVILCDNKISASSSVSLSPLQRLHKLCRNFFQNQFAERTPMSSPLHNVTWETRSKPNPTPASAALHILPEYVYFIEVLLNSQLILKDDLNILEHFIPNKEKHQVLSKKYNYEGSFVLPGTLVLCIVGVNKYYFNNNVRYVLPCIGFTVSSYYLLHKLYTSYQLSMYKQDLHSLISVIQNYSNLIHKNIQFIRDFETISKIHTGHGSGSALLSGKSNKEAWCRLPHLRYNLLASLNTMCSLAYYNVLELVARFPFNPHLDPYIKHGLCCLDLNELGVSDVPLDRVDEITVKTLMKVKYIYFLLLSEFLSRIILCFCPYSSSSIPHPLSVGSLFRLINRTSAVYTEQFSHLENLFNVVTIHKTQVEGLGPLSTISNPWSSDRKYEELVKTIHCIETYLLFMLTQYKHMETNIGSYQHSDCMVNDSVILHDIHTTHDSIRHNQLRSLLYNIDCLNIQLSQCLGAGTSDVIRSRDPPSVVEAACTASGVHVGFSDFDVANVRDEIFLGIAGVPVVSNVLAGGGEGKTFLDEDQVNYYEFERQFSSTVLSELKEKLKDKQVEWKRREKLALEEKQQHDFSDLEVEVEVKVEEAKEDAHRKRRKRKSITKTHAIESLSDTEDSPAPKQHPPRSSRAKATTPGLGSDSPRSPRVKPAAPALGSLITDGNTSSLLSAEDCDAGAPSGDNIKYKRLYNLSRSQESYENRETSPSSGDELEKPEDARRSAESHALENQLLAAALARSQSSLASQIEQVAREWKYTSIEEEFGDVLEEEEEK